MGRPFSWPNPSAIMTGHAPISEMSRHMATEFKLPELGENINEAQVVSVMVSEGDAVEAEQDVIEVETDKAVMPVPAPAAGTIGKLSVKEGDTLKVGDLIATIEEGDAAASEGGESEEGEKAEAKDQSAEAERKEDKSAKKAEKAEAKQGAKVEAASGAGTPWESQDVEGAGEAAAKPQATEPTEREHGDEPGADRLPVFASPSVRRFAREVGVDIADVEGTGPGGRISEDDVKSHAREHGSGNGRAAASGGEGGPLPDFSKQGPVEREALSMLAKKTAEHMAMCWATIPHVTLNETIDATDFEDFRQANKRVAEKAGGKLTPTAMLVKVVVAALKQYPILNCSYDAKQQELIKKGYYHIGVAADTPRGLVVPVIRNADAKSLVDIAVELGELAEKARAGKLTLDDMAGASFTITNLGGIGVGHFTPIVNHPEVGILGVGTARETDGRLMMPVSLSFDHRVVNGADGARFLTWIKNAIEQPLGALLGL